MSDSQTVLCIATYHKGDEFLKECDRQGCRVLLVTDEKLKDSDWPREAIDAFYYVRRDMNAMPHTCGPLAGGNRRLLKGIAIEVMYPKSVTSP